METGEYLLRAFFARVGIGLFNDLRIIFNDNGKPLLRQDLFPEIGGLQAVGIDGIACALPIALVERQKPRTLAGKLRAELDITVIHGKVNHAALELEKQFFRVAVGLVLFDGVEHVLLGEAVLQLAGHHGQTVDEQAQIEGKARMVGRILKLPGDAEDILRKTLLRGFVAFGRKLKKASKLAGPCLNPLRSTSTTPRRAISP